MQCQICGAICVCKKASKTICCSCHPHKGRTSVLASVRAMNREDLPEEWIAAIARHDEQAAAPEQLAMFAE